MKAEQNKIPILSKVILSFFLNFSHPKSMLGDIEETYAEIAAERNKSAAKLWLLFQILITIPAFFKNYFYWSAIMFRNYFKIAFRNLSRQYVYSFINISGLALAIACCLFIFLFVRDELNYDKFHKDKDRIYRVAVRSQSQTSSDSSAQICAPVVQVLRDDFPEVEKVTGILPLSSGLISYKDKRFYEQRRVYADKHLFSVLTIPFLQGDPATALERPLTVVITQRMANKYFGKEEPLGKIIGINSGDYEITGIVADSPHNTHFKYDFILSMKTIENRYPFEAWFLANFHVYLKTKPDIDYKTLSAQVAQIAENYAKERMEKGDIVNYFLQPVPDIHLYSHLRYEAEPPMDPKYLYIFAAVACLGLLGLASFTTEQRKKEIGVRKVLGSSVTGIVWLLSKEFTKWVLIANLFAWPVAWYIANNWLQNFAYHTSVGISTFFISGLFALLIAILTVSYQAIKGAMTNPVKMLRHE